MWTRLAAISLLAVAFAGCTDGDAGTDGIDASVNATIEAEVVATLTTYSCEVAAGAVVVSLTTGLANVGGCSLVELESAAVAHEASVPEGCRIVVDLDGDGLSDEDVQIGKEYQAGHNIFSTCETGITDVEVSITMAT